MPELPGRDVENEAYSYGESANERVSWGMSGPGKCGTRTCVHVRHCQVGKLKSSNFISTRMMFGVVTVNYKAGSCDDNTGSLAIFLGHNLAHVMVFLGQLPLSCHYVSRIRSPHENRKL